MREGTEPGRANNQENPAPRSKSKGLQVWLKAPLVRVRQQQRQRTLKKAVKERKQQEGDQRRDQEHPHQRMSLMPNQGFRKKKMLARPSHRSAPSPPNPAATTKPPTPP